MSKLKFRRFVLQAGCVAALAAAGIGSAQAQEKTRLRVSVIPIVDVAPIYAAIKEGYFKAEGLEVDTSPVAGGAGGIPGLMGGAYDFVFSNVVSIVLARSQGLPLKIVAPGSAARNTPPDLAAVFVRKGENLKRGADLQGKSMAVNTRNNIIWLYGREWVAQTGGDANKVNYREVPFPQMTDALKGKQVDSIFVVEPFVSKALADPALEVVAYPYPLVQPTGVSVSQYVATEDFIAKNPETVRKFAAAMKKGAQWVNANMGNRQFAELVGGYTRMDPSQVTQMTIANAPLSVPNDSVDKTITLMTRHGMLTAPIRAESMIQPTAR